MKMVLQIRLTSMLLLTACASTKGPPPEVAAAQSAVQRARAGTSAELAPVQLHLAEKTLERAEFLAQENRGSQQARDLAYVATRQAEIAEVTAHGEEARQEADRAKSQLEATQASSQKAAIQELANARAELERTEQELQNVFSKLSELGSKVRTDDRGYVITLSGNVLFQTGKTALLPAAKDQLDQIARTLRDAKAPDIVIEGYTDGSGSAEINNALSQGRASAVRAYLRSKGLSAAKVSAVGRGSTRPVASNRTAEGRASNRRVEIVVQGRESATR